MKFRRGLTSLLAFILIALALPACKSKDLVSLAGIDASDLYLADKYGNKVRISDGVDFLKALEAAKRLDDPDVAKSETEADYVFISQDQKVYYETEGKHLIFVDKNQKKTVYSGDLGTLIAKVPGLPPLVKVRPIDGLEGKSWTTELSRAKEPAAMLFQSGTSCGLLVSAGERPSGGYTMDLEKVSLDPSGLTVIKIRLTAPLGPATVGVDHPKLELWVDGNPEIAVQMVAATKDGEKVEHVSLARVVPEQNVIAVRPERGSLVTEVVKMAGFARSTVDSFVVEVEDGHYVLGKKTVRITENESDWRYFEFTMDLQPASSPNGMVIFSRPGGAGLTELLIPVSFGGK